MDCPLDDPTDCPKDGYEKMAKKRTLSIHIKKAVLYVRVSTHWQIDKDSLPVQRKELEYYCRYVLGIDDFVILEDAGYSAKNTDRPAYQEMMSRIRTGEFSHLLVWKIDRISRNLLDFVNMYEELKDLGVVFVSKNEQFDTSTALGEAMLKLTLIFAEMERKVTSERVTDIMLSRADAGKWNGGHSSYGYQVTKGVYTIVEEEAAVVKMMFDMYEAGKSLLNVARTINAMGIKTRRGHEWSATTVWIVIDNPVYCGTYRYNLRNEQKGSHEWSFREDKDVIYVEDHHPAIISKEQFKRCQEILDRRNSKKRGTPKTYERKHTHIFAGLLTCGICGSQMSATIDRARKGGWRPSIYHCTKRRKSHACQNKYVSDARIGPFVMNYLSNMMKTYKAFGESTTPSTLEKKLLRGPAMKDVAGIEQEGLLQTFEAFKNGGNLTEIFTLPANTEPDAAPVADERNLLENNKRRLERALNRLKALFMYNDAEMSEVEYATERHKLLDELNSVNERLRHLESLTENSMVGDSEWMEQASYFLITQELMSKRSISYETLLKAVDSKTIKLFINLTVQNFCILDGKIASITFKSGIIHKFLYKTDQ